MFFKKNTESMSFSSFCFLLIFSSAIALTLPISKQALAHFEPAMMQTWKCLFIAVFAIFFLKKPRKEEVLPIFLASVLLFTVCYTLGAMAIKYNSNQNTVGFLSYMEGPLSALMAALFLGEKMPKHYRWGFSFCIVGIAAIVIPSLKSEPLGLLAAIGWIVSGALGQTYLKKAIDKARSTSILLWCYIFSVPQFFLYSILFEQKPLPSTNIAYGYVLIVAALSLAAMVSWSLLLKRYTMSYIQPFSLLTAVTIPVANYLVLGQKMSLNHFFGVTWILLGVATVSFKRDQEKILDSSKVAEMGNV